MSQTTEWMTALGTTGAVAVAVGATWIDHFRTSRSSSVHRTEQLHQDRREILSRFALQCATVGEGLNSILQTLGAPTGNQQDLRDRAAVARSTRIGLAQLMHTNVLLEGLALKPPGAVETSPLEVGASSFTAWLEYRTNGAFSDGIGKKQGLRDWLTTQAERCAAGERWALDQLRSIGRLDQSE